MGEKWTDAQFQSNLGSRTDGTPARRARRARVQGMLDVARDLEVDAQRILGAQEPDALPDAIRGAIEGVQDAATERIAKLETRIDEQADIIEELQAGIRNLGRRVRDMEDAGNWRIGERVVKLEAQAKRVIDAFPSVGELIDPETTFSITAEGRMALEDMREGDDGE